jgi:hypothetical protein
MRELIGSWIASAQHHADILSTALTVVIFVIVVLVCLDVATSAPGGGLT